MRKSKEFNPMDLHDLDLLEELQKLHTKDLDKEVPPLGVAIHPYTPASPVLQPSFIQYQGGSDSPATTEVISKKDEEKAQLESLT